MANGNTANVKLGVCLVYLDGVDLGLTKGGVEVTVSTDTHKVMVDQFGKTTVNENIVSREVKVKVPLAETTIENMVRTMPGSTLTTSGGAAATGTITIGVNPTAGQTVVVNGTTVTFRTSPTAVPANNEVNLGATATLTAAALAAALHASTNPKIAIANYTVAALVVTATFMEKGLDGNAFALAAGTSGVTVSGALLTGGVAYTAGRSDVTTGIGVSLLSIAKELRLHPKGKPISDRSDDFVIPLAATAGGLKYAYKVDDERIFDIEYTGYPDPLTDRLFFVGDEAAV